MIKKILSLLIISIIGLIGFSSAKYVNFGSPIYQFGDNTCYIGSDLSFNCTKSGKTLTSYDPGYLKTVNSLFWTSDGIGFYYNFPNNQTFQGLINTGFYICSGDFTNVHSGDSVMYSNQSCIYAGTKVNVGSYDNLINLLTSKTPNLVGTFYPSGYGIILSLVYDDFYFSLYLGGYTDNYPSNGSYELKNMGITGYDYETLRYGNNVLTSPRENNNFNPGTGNIISNGTTKYLNADIDDYISYYEERFGWNESMCYVGTTDYETLYGSGKICNDLECPETVSFEYGTGGTIFDLYYSLYSGFGNNIIKNVGTFINVWLINYTEQFKLNCDGTGDNIVCQSSGPDYLAKYNGPDTNISLYYEGLTPPFLNNPVAIYFMASNLYNRFSTESTQGEEMAFYCNMKLNYDNYKDGIFNFEELKDKVTSGINQRVKDYKDKEIGNSGGYSIPDFSGTNIRGNLNLTGSGIPEDLSPTELFKQFYDRMNALLGNFNPNNSLGIIPLWILYPMLFLILFRIIKH